MAAPWLLVGSQYLGALAVEPSFLGKGFGALVLTPVGAAAHLGALAAAEVIQHLGARPATSLKDLARQNGLLE
jgi:hypothetical protein